MQKDAKGCKRCQEPFAILKGSWHLFLSLFLSIGTTREICASAGGRHGASPNCGRVGSGNGCDQNGEVLPRTALVSQTPVIRNRLLPSNLAPDSAGNVSGSRGNRRAFCDGASHKRRTGSRKCWSNPGDRAVEVLHQQRANVI